MLSFTDHVRDLETKRITYRPASGHTTYRPASGPTRTAIRSTADVAVDNLDVECLLSDEGIAEESLHTGRDDQLREPGAGHPELEPRLARRDVGEGSERSG